MIHLGEKIIPSKDKLGRTKAHTILRLKCDYCGLIFVRRKIKRDTNRDYHFDKPECRYASMKKGGILNKKLRETNIKNYGVEYPSQNKDIKEKCVKTWIKSRGVDNPAKCENVKRKTEKTCLKRFKNKHAIASECVRKKTAETLRKRYGVINASQADRTKETFVKTSIRKYGVSNPMKSESVRSKLDYKDIWRKSHKTKKKNGTYARSKIEDYFFEFLKSNVDVLVERSVPVNGWEIDFYLPRLKIYIQFDGIYWHGLDRDIKTIFESNISRDASIYSAYLRDRKQDIWFSKNNLKLLRITDKQYKCLSSGKLVNIIKDT